MAFTNSTTITYVSTNSGCALDGEQHFQQPIQSRSPKWIQKHILAAATVSMQQHGQEHGTTEP
jgi:hypothetical protein